MRYGFLEELFRTGGSAQVSVADTSAPTQASEDQTAAFLVSLVGTTTAARTVVLQQRASGFSWVFINETANAVTVQPPTGTGLSIAAGDTTLAIIDRSGNLKKLTLGTGGSGIDAYTVTTAGFTMPAVSSTVTISVAESRWLSVGQVVYVQSAGYFWVTAKPSNTSVTIQNIGLAANAAPATVVATARSVSAAGEQGAVGAGGATAGSMNRQGSTTIYPMNETWIDVGTWTGRNTTDSGVTTDIGAGTITIGTTGRYRVTCTGVVNQSAAGLSSIEARLVRNGTQIPGYYTGPQESGSKTMAIMTWGDEVDLTAGDVLKLQLKAGPSANTLTVPAAHFTVEKIENSGATGQSAHTTTTAGFTMPAVSATVTVPVVSATWLTIGQMLYVQSAGYMRVSAVPTTTSVTLENVGLAGNAAPTTAIATSRTVSAAGEKGLDGWSINVQRPTGSATMPAARNLLVLIDNPAADTLISLPLSAGGAADGDVAVVALKGNNNSRKITVNDTASGGIGGGVFLLSPGTNTAGNLSAILRFGATENKWGVVAADATTAPIIGFQEYIGDPTLGQMPRSTDALPQTLLISAQEPFATATGANRKPGNLKLKAGTPTNGGTTYGRIEMEVAGNKRCEVAEDVVRCLDGVRIYDVANNADTEMSQTLHRKLAYNNGGSQVPATGIVESFTPPANGTVSCIMTLTGKRTSSTKEVFTETVSAFFNVVAGAVTEQGTNTKSERKGTTAAINTTTGCQVGISQSAGVIRYTFIGIDNDLNATWDVTATVTWQIQP